MKRGAPAIDRLIVWSPVLLLASLAGLTYWLNAQVQEQQPRRDGSARHEPDLFIESFRAVSFDTDGFPRQGLSAKRGQHYPDDDSTDFIEPSVVLSEPGKPRFSVTANKGALSGDRETISLAGNVRAVRDADATAADAQKSEAKGSAAKSKPAKGAKTGTTADSGDPAGPVTMTTEFLRIVPKEGRASTDKAVTIEEPRGIIHGVGMELDNKAKTLKLNSGVRGTLQPAQTKK
jgi:lipopolysaccharide export system protein LptC